MERLFSGMQPTQDAHIGNWLGAIRNWVALQDRYECLYCVVDLHALTAPYDPRVMRERVLNLAAAFLACGVDPAKSTVFVQSAVPEHTELTWLLACQTGLGALERMTQFKDKSDQNADNINAGLLFYPVLMAADILAYRAQVVPVGEDQVQHLELAREIVRKFNRAFGDTFPEPRPIVPEGSAKRILGLDGNAKMSKSKGNAIALVEEPATVRKLLASAYTDPERKRRTDPGRPEVCNVFTLHGFFTAPSRVEGIAGDCRSAALGCVDCKKELAENLLVALEPIRRRYLEVRADEEGLRAVLAAGAERARALARETLVLARRNMGLVEGGRRA
ncbi:MAG: tryptophan--tRNA ligase [Planctomycetes bacterium]|nr:tryptophan--tRNA ligase [Planctomycetota bacterium]